MVIMKDKYVGEDRVERSLKSATNSFKFLYYFTAVTIGYFIIKDLDCLPPKMGGRGVLSNIFFEYP